MLLEHFNSGGGQKLAESGLDKIFPPGSVPLRFNHWTKR